MTNYHCRNCGKSIQYNLLYCTIQCQNEARKIGYGHTALRFAEGKYFLCQQCGKHLREKRKYCSDACKQTAYRRRKDPKSGTYERVKDRAQRAARTKRRTYKTIICEHCGSERRFDTGACSNRKYCTDACKQAAYRQRKLLSAQSVTQKLEKL